MSQEDLRQRLLGTLQLVSSFEDGDIRDQFCPQPSGFLVYTEDGFVCAQLPLSGGRLVGDSIVCPYRASRFALEDGRVLDGPAVHPQPSPDIRVRDGRIEVRKT